MTINQINIYFVFLASRLLIIVSSTIIFYQSGTEGIRILTIQCYGTKIWSVRSYRALYLIIFLSFQENNSYGYQASKFHNCMWTNEGD